MTPADAWLPIETHPSTFIREEMDARGWTVRDLAVAMDGDPAINLLTLDLYFTVGPARPNMRLGKTAASLGRAFGVSADLFLNLEAAWLAVLPPPPEATDGQEPQA